MFLLNYLLSALLLLSTIQEDTLNIDKCSCDLNGNWSQVKFLIDIKGATQSLTFPKEGLPEEHFLEYAQRVHLIYFSGNGNLDIDLGTTLSLSKKKLTYKGTKLGRYKLSDDCKTITLRNQKNQNNPDIFASCKVLHRYENIIAMEQGKEVVFYLKRDSKNPFFVGDQ